MKTLLNRQIVVVLLMFSIIYSGSMFLPATRTIIAFFDGNQSFLTFAEIIAGAVALLFYALFYGWITELIVSKIKNRKVSLVDSLTRIKFWFPRSLAAVFIGWLGIVVISLLMAGISSDFLFSFLAFLICGLWITLTFTFYPVIITSRKSIFQSVVEAFAVSIKSVNRWFHLLLLLFLVSGGFVYIFIPNEIAVQFTNTSENLSGWMVHFEWLGGYSFKPNWYIDYSKSLNIFPSKLILAILFFINSVFATFIKTKVAQILVELGYLGVNTENEIETYNVFSAAESKYLPNEHF